MTQKPCFLTLASALHSRTCAPNLARRFAVKHPPNPTKTTTARAVDGARFEQARQILVRRFAASNTPNPTKPTSTSYTFPVTSKKGVIGIGVPTHPLRRKPQSLPQSTCGLFVRASIFWRLGQGAARLAGSRKRVSGTPTCSSCRLQLALGAVVFANHTRLEAFHG